MTEHDAINRTTIMPTCLHYMAQTVDWNGILVVSVSKERRGLSSGSHHCGSIFRKGRLNDKEPMNPQCPRERLNQLCGTVTNYDLFRINTPECGQRLPQIPTGGIRIMTQQMSGLDDGFPHVWRGP